MKSYNDLFRNVVDPANIYEAILAASKNKMHKKNVQKAVINAHEIAEDLSKRFIDGTWRPAKIHRIKEINDGVAQKKRQIVCPSFVNELVASHAIIRVIEPYFRKKFYTYSCGSVKGRGAEMMIKYLKKSILHKPKQIKYVAKLDIKKFFDNAKPSWIFHEVRKTIRDRKVLGLIAKILRANTIVIDGKKVKRGIPIGLYTSPIFANILLNHIDHYVKEVLRIKIYARYMDDIILFHSNKRELKRACLYIQNEVRRLGMNLKPIWQVHVFNKIDFVGYQYSRKAVILHKKIFLKIKRVMSSIKKKSYPTGYDCTRIMSYCSRFKNTDAKLAFKTYITDNFNLGYIRKRIAKFSQRKLKYAIQIS